MAYSEKLSDIIAAGKCEVYYTETFSVCIVIAHSMSRAITQVIIS